MSAGVARGTATTLSEVLAECQGCAWTSTTRNSLGLAARHHDATGHVVRTDVTRTVVYGDTDAALEAAGQERLPGT